jgi:hypothetical protein
MAIGKKPSASKLLRKKTSGERSTNTRQPCCTTNLCKAKKAFRHTDTTAAEQSAR